MKNAFTLIELLFVLILIGIISALGLQSFNQLRDDARKQTLIARIKQLNIAKQQFISERGRLESAKIWAAPQAPQGRDLGGGQFSVYTPLAWVADQAQTDEEARYNILKRYIERPQARLVDVAPKNCQIIDPRDSNNLPDVNSLYTGTIHLESSNTDLTVSDTP